MGCLKTLSVSKALQPRSIIVAGLSVALGPVMAVDDITQLRSVTFIHILKLNVETENVMNISNLALFHCRAVFLLSYHITLHLSCEWLSSV